MRRSLAVTVVTALTALGACAQEPDKRSPEFRKSYMEKMPSDSLSTTAGDAMMLRILAESRGARRGIEIGVAHGYGAINMGIAFERTGGHLYSVEIDPRRVAEARQHIAAVGLEKTITVIEGDALKILPALEGEFDFVFIDANKRDYLRYLKAVEPKLKKGAVVVADNVIVSERSMPDFLGYVKTSPDYDTVTIRASMEKNDGMTVSYKIR